MISVTIESAGYVLEWDVSDEPFLYAIMPEEITYDFDEAVNFGGGLFLSDLEAQALGEAAAEAYKVYEANGYLERDVYLDLYSTLRNAGIDLPEIFN